MTNTITPSITQTFTMVFTWTPTIVPTKEVFDVTDIIIYPNPLKPGYWNELNIRFIPTQNCSKITMVIYTNSFRKIKEIHLTGNYTAGLNNNEKINSRLFRHMANGIYYYYFIFESENGQKLRVRPEELVILK